jgi:GNAT superfamily N-acetyltransferase
MSAVTIRRLVAPDDVTDAALLLQQFFKEEGFSTPAEIIAARTRQMVALDSCGVFVAYDAAIAVGVATVSMEFGIEYGWSAEMGDLYVAPEQRGRGISRHLVSSVEDFLRSRGASGYQVTVTFYAAHQHDIAALYQLLGFEDESREILWKSLV